MIRYALSPSPSARGPRAASDQARGWPPRTRRAERGPHPRGQGTGGRSGGQLPRRMSGKPKGCLHRLRPVCRHRRHYRGVSRSPSWRRAIGHTRLPENTSPCNGGAKPVAHKPDCRGNISPPSVINLSCGVGGVQRGDGVQSGDARPLSKHGNSGRAVGPVGAFPSRYHALTRH